MADRLEDFQRGPFACQESADMLAHINGALLACAARAARMVEESYNRSEA
ncbi:hypothetical protein PQR64_30790 [Paraburkholderia phytofirmans]